MRKPVRILAVILTLLTLVACSNPGGGGTTTFNYSGEWVGTVDDYAVGKGEAKVSMTQVGMDVFGNWVLTKDGVIMNSGDATGVVNGDDVALELRPSDPTTCPYNVLVTRSGNTLSGTYTAFNCTVALGGSINLIKK